MRVASLAGGYTPPRRIGRAGGVMMSGSGRRPAIVVVPLESASGTSDFPPCTGIGLVAGCTPASQGMLHKEGVVMTEFWHWLIFCI